MSAISNSGESLDWNRFDYDVKKVIDRFLTNLQILHKHDLFGKLSNETKTRIIMMVMRKRENEEEWILIMDLKKIGGNTLN